MNVHKKSQKEKISKKNKVHKIKSRLLAESIKTDDKLKAMDNGTNVIK